MGEMGPVGIPKFGPGIPAPNPATLMDAPLVENIYAWTKKSAMLFVEQPGGTGFSTASSEWAGEEAEKRVMDDVADAFYAFLQNVYTVFGDNLAKKRLYLSGESFAGMYIVSDSALITLRMLIYFQAPHFVCSTAGDRPGTSPGEQEVTRSE